jgi:hypothetical protein
LPQKLGVMLGKTIRPVERNHAGFARLPECQRVKDRLGKNEARRVFGRTGVKGRAVASGR